MARKTTSLPEKFEPGFLAKLDGRTEISRLLHSNYLAIVADLGGESELSHIKLALVERFVFLEAVLCGIESQLAVARAAKAKNDVEAARKVEVELIGRWIQAVNSLTGLAKTLGIERRANNPWNAVDALRASNGHVNGSDHADE
jgi:hypothetical protein